MSAQRNKHTISTPAGQKPRVVAVPTREYVVSGLPSGAWYAKYPKALPWPLDDVSRDFGDDIYERMILDPKITETITILKTGIIEEGLLLNVPVGELSGDNITQATEILAAANSMLENLLGDPDAILWNMLDALYLGNKVAELIFGYVEEGGKLRLDVTHIHVKPRRGVAFVVDAYGHVLGLIGRSPTQPYPLISGPIDPATDPNFIPREKFWVFTSRPRDEDIRGTSILRPAFEFWNIKHQIIREYLKYLTQFASASLFATTAEGADFTPERDPVTGELTGKTVNPWETLKTALESFRNGSVMTAPYGTVLKEIFSQGDGTAFIRALDYLRAEIVSSILGQTLATEESKHQSRAAASTHLTILDAIIRQAKRSLCRSIRRDVLVPWVARNWGEAAVPLTPTVSLGESELPNLPEIMTAVANLFNSAYLSPSQLTGLDQLLNLSQRTPEEMDQVVRKFEQGIMTPNSGNRTPSAPSPATAPDSPRNTPTNNPMEQK